MLYNVLAVRFLLQTGAFTIQLQIRGGRSSADQTKDSDFSSSTLRSGSENQILVVGDGDFSFSGSLNRQPGYSNVIATSFEDLERLKHNYPDAKRHIKFLKKRNARVMHGIDAQRLSIYEGIRGIRFDQIIFNLPFTHPSKAQRNYFAERRSAIGAAIGDQKSPYDHVAFAHRLLLDNFLREAAGLLSADGEIHVSNSKMKVYDSWMMPCRGSQHVLFKKEEPFNFTICPFYKPAKTHNFWKGRLQHREFIAPRNFTTYVFVRRDNPDGKNMSCVDDAFKDEWRWFCEKFGQSDKLTTEKPQETGIGNSIRQQKQELILWS